MFEENYTSKSMQLLQILFLHLENGIPKEQLLAELYSRDDVENRNGSLNNTIFRLRRQLEAAGLPKGKYFSLKDGIYRWDPVISVETDLSLFEKKLEESREETDEEKKAELLKEACSMYTGELLPNMIGEDWAAVANIHYRDLYFEALQELCGYLKEKEHFEAVYQLTTAAAQIYPFEVWQLWRIDSLIAMNRYQDAIVVYKEATKHFFDDLGLPPSREMLERFQLMSERIQQSVGALGEIKRAFGKKKIKKGALLLLSKLYRHLSCDRTYDGTGMESLSHIMLCTLTDKTERSVWEPVGIKRLQSPRKSLSATLSGGETFIPDTMRASFWSCFPEQLWKAARWSQPGLTGILKRFCRTFPDQLLYGFRGRTP